MVVGRAVDGKVIDEKGNGRVGGGGDDRRAEGAGFDQLFGDEGADLFAIGQGFPLRGEDYHPKTFAVIEDFAPGIDTFGVTPMDHDMLDPQQFDTNSDGRLDTADSGTAYGTSEIDGVARTGLLFDIGKIANYGPIQTTEVFIPGLIGLNAADVTFQF